MKYGRRKKQKDLFCENLRQQEFHSNSANVANVGINVLSIEFTRYEEVFPGIFGGHRRLQAAKKNCCSPANKICAHSVMNGTLPTRFSSV